MEKNLRFINIDFDGNKLMEAFETYVQNTFFSEFD